MSYKARLHGIIYVPAVCFAVVSFSALAMYLITIDHPSWLLVLGLIGLGLGAISWLVSFIRRRTTFLEITDNTVELSYGLLKRTNDSIALSRVEGVKVNQTLIGRMFGYGDVIVGGTGGDRNEVREIQKPHDFKRELERARTA